MLQRIRTLALAFVLATPVVLVLAPSDANAQFRIGPHVGVAFDAGDALIGADAWIGLTNITDSIELHLNPAFSWYFAGEHVTHFSFDVNVPFLFRLSGTDVVAPYAAPGLAVRHTRVNVDLGPLGEHKASDTDVAFNLIGGALFLPEQRINPFAQFKAVLGDGSDVVLMGGVMFKI